VTAAFDPNRGRESLRKWFEEGLRGGHKIMLVSQDTFDHEDADGGIDRHYFDTLSEAKAFERRQLGGIDQLREVFDLTKSFESQIKSPPVKTLGGPQGN
jgi:hypothetical protein